MPVAASASATRAISLKGSWFNNLVVQLLCDDRAALQLRHKSRNKHNLQLHRLQTSRVKACKDGLKLLSKLKEDLKD